MDNIAGLLANFAVKGNLIVSVPYGTGLINSTFICTFDSGLVYVAQKMSSEATEGPVELMENYVSIADHLASKYSDRRNSIHLVPTVDGKSYYVSETGDFWRVMEFITDSYRLNVAESLDDLYQSGKAFGEFHRRVSDFPVGKLHQIIPNFHNTPERFGRLKAAVFTAGEERSMTCRDELNFLLAREDGCGVIVDAVESGDIPRRVTHNDARLNNVLMDYDSKKSLCVIDLDTVMPGSLLYDFGEAVRRDCVTFQKGETDLNKVDIDLDKLRSFTHGFLVSIRSNITEKEKELLPVSIKLMSLELAVVHLTAYLNSEDEDVSNIRLLKARTQIKLLTEIEKKWDDILSIFAELQK